MTGETDERQDDGTRDRIDDLIRFLKRQVVLQWAAIATMFVVLVIVAGSVGYLLGQHSTTLDRIDTNRYRALVDICQANNREAKGLRRFVRTVSPRLTPLARRTFPLTTSCPAYARDLVEDPP